MHWKENMICIHFIYNFSFFLMVPFRFVFFASMHFPSVSFQFVFFASMHFLGGNFLVFFFY
jgi:hypothetical protein